ncbi:UNVERIFIED_ORG: FMN-dependent NADH-azoreductase [Xanthomonas campestris]
MKLLHLDSSILGAYSVSRQLSAATVAKLQSGNSDIAVSYRDLAA